MNKQFVFFYIVMLLGNISFAQTHTEFIVIDQFGYLPTSQKIAVIRNPQIGYDDSRSFEAGSKYAIVNAQTDAIVFEGEAVIWKNGKTDQSSGDQVWHFDFSSVIENGRYYVLDIDKNKRSYEFQISAGVYNEVLKHAVRTFFYQRVGYEKKAPFADVAWEDAASHIGDLQDKNCRPYNEPNNAAKEKDLSGGWYDAGDLNKYTSWTANYVVEMLRAYDENPGAWGDDYNIPESGNGIPDLLDEVKWGMDHLLRLQEEDGGVLSIVAEDHASPPSSATGQSLYGPSTTAATLNTVAAYALGVKVYNSLGLTDYALELLTAARKGWVWAGANPNVQFRNNDSNSGSTGIGAGQQEVDDYGRMMAKLEAATFLFAVTGETEYRDFFDQNFEEAHLLQWNYAYPFETENQDALLYYTTLEAASESVKDKILNTYKNAILNGEENLVANQNVTDPYFAHLKDYTWGSNNTKSKQGNGLYDIIVYGIDEASEQDAYNAAESYIHYIHGLNPLNKIYLSNMYSYGGDNCVNEFYHTWFSNGSSKWDRVGESTYGPAPGFLVGGPNPSYDVDSCCPNNCGGSGSNDKCTSEDLFPPKNQPSQKSYKDFNTSWPLNSWSVTENSCGYQVSYIRLLSKFVNANYDCNGKEGGTAFLDACGICSGGDTGRQAETDSEVCEKLTLSIDNDLKQIQFNLFPNPSDGLLNVEFPSKGQWQLRVLDSSGKEHFTTELLANDVIDLKHLNSGFYIVHLSFESKVIVKKFIKL